MSSKTYAYLENEVIIWARNRGIPQNSSPFAQALKTLEEAGELLDAAHRGDKAAMADAYGDVLVTLLVGAETAGMDLLECLNAAYSEIKNRKGYLRPDGVFVKEN